jgi:hypothetical protein
MENNISFIETDEINNQIQVILRQTNYSEEEAREKLKEQNYDHLKVIKGYLGLTEKKAPTEKKSVNQEIYRQLRHKLDSNMRDYHTRVENGEVKKVI